MILTGIFKMLMFKLLKQHLKNFIYCSRQKGKLPFYKLMVVISAIFFSKSSLLTIVLLRILVFLE